MNPPTNICGGAIRTPVPPVCSPHTARWSRQSFSGVQPAWPFIWVMWHMTNMLEHLPWHLITVGKSWWYLLLYLWLLSNIYKEEMLPAHRVWFSVWHLCVMVPMLIHPKNPWGKKKEKKKIYFFSLESNVLEVIRSKVGLAPVAPVAGKVLEALHFDLLHLECEFLSPQVV